MPRTVPGRGRVAARRASAATRCATASPRCLADDAGEATPIAELISGPENLLARDQAIIIAECCALIARVRRARAAALGRMALTELSAFERYERRALSRRRRAIDALAAYTLVKIVYVIDTTINYVWQNEPIAARDYHNARLAG